MNKKIITDLFKVVENKNLLDYLISNNIINKDSLIKEIAKSNNSRLIYNASVNINITEEELNILVEAIIKTNDIYYINLFAKDNRNLSKYNINKLADIIINTNDSREIYKFARNVENAPIEKLEEAIIKNNNVEYIYIFARDINKASIDKLEKEIIASGNSKYIYNFAKDIKNANIDALTDAIIKTNDIEYIIKFIEINTNQIDKIVNAILKTNDEYAIETLRNYIWECWLYQKTIEFEKAKEINDMCNIKLVLIKEEETKQKPKLRIKKNDNNE